MEISQYQLSIFNNYMANLNQGEKHFESQCTKLSYLTDL